jgi:hypothetical protein
MFLPESEAAITGSDSVREGTNGSALHCVLLDRFRSGLSMLIANKMEPRPTENRDFSGIC